jgi:hypothetical protein
MTSSFSPVRSGLFLNSSGVDVVMPMQDSGKFVGTLMASVASSGMIRSWVAII